MKSLWNILFLFSVVLAPYASVADAATIQLDVEVDATDLPRRLLHSRMEIPVSGDTLSLWYPKWIPGIHAPRGPIGNLGGLTVETLAGDSVSWRRDGEERYLFHVDVPEGQETLVVSLDYRCNQPTTNSRGIDSFGNSLVGVINWNTCLLYPDGYDTQDIVVRLELRLPDAWKYATAIPTKDADDSMVRFEDFSFHDVVDSPLICGEYLRSIKLDAENAPPVYLDLVSESEGVLQIDEALEEKYGRMVSEAQALFGGAHFDEYHLLLVMSDEFPYTGLEHLRSSLNGIGERDLEDEDDIDSWVGYLLPHEFAHSWCGKYRRPEGMATPDFHTTKRTNVLWVYEGLDQYLGEILAVRSGIWDIDTYKESLALKTSRLMHQKGRRWRSLEDTAADSYHLRGGSRNWSNLRRGQDYYNEGLLLWMEIDTILREESDGNRSLDDFCRRFMGPDLPDVAVHPYTLEDILTILDDLEDYDWATLIQSWVEEPIEHLPLKFLEGLGYRLQYATEASQLLSDRETDRHYSSAQDSLGMSVNSDGKITGSIVPGMPADEAGLAPGMEIVGVNGHKFTTGRFKDAIADSVTRHGIELLLLDGDKFRTVTVEYDDGPKYLELVRDESRSDLIEAIFKPLVTGNDTEVVD